MTVEDSGNGSGSADAPATSWPHCAECGGLLDGDLICHGCGAEASTGGTLIADGGNTLRTDGGFQEVCDECGRHIAVAGHDPDCPESDRDEQ